MLTDGRIAHYTLRIVAVAVKVKVLELHMFDHFDEPMVPSRPVVLRPPLWRRVSFLNNVILHTGHG